MAVLLTFWLALTTALAQSAAPKHRAQVTVVGTISVTVSNLQRSAEFYSRVLAFQEIARNRRSATLELGGEQIELIQSTTPDPQPIPPEQAALNNVPGAHLRIITLRAANGPGIELLEYLKPRTGRDLPYHPRASDLVHRQATVFVANATAIANVDSKLQSVSAADAAQAPFIVRDDGHELLLRPKAEK